MNSFLGATTDEIVDNNGKGGVTRVVVATESFELCVNFFRARLRRMERATGATRRDVDSTEAAKRREAVRRREGPASPPYATTLRPRTHNCFFITSFLLRPSRSRRPLYLRPSLSISEFFSAR